MSHFREEEKYHFEDNNSNSLPKISLNKKIVFIGFSLLIFIIIVYGLIYGEIILPGRRNQATYFKGYSLIVLILAGFVWIFHFLVQIFANYTNDENKNNILYKYAYNSRVLGVILLFIAYLLSIILYDSKGYPNFPDSKYKKEYKIFW